MTATGTAVTPPSAPRGLLGRLRRVRDNLANPNKEARTLLSSQEVQLRGPQSTSWSIIVGVLGTCLVAGAYYLLLEQRWYIHMGSFNHGSSLKLWWDNGMGFIHSKVWYLYRHGVRDLGEPAVFTMAGKTLMAKPKYWGVRVGTARLIISPIVVVVLTVALALGGVWLLDFGLPAAWAHIFSAAGHPGYRLSGFSLLGKFSAGQLIVGILIGLVLHRFWAPAGATLQGFAIDRSVDRAQSRNGGEGRIPLWEKLPLAPPVIRERFAKGWRENKTIQVLGSHRVVLSIMLFLITVVTIVGIIAKFWIAHGHTFPYLAP